MTLAATLLLPLLLMAGGVVLASALGRAPSRWRMGPIGQAWLVALAPAAAFAVLAGGTAPLRQGKAIAASFEWVPSLGLRVGLQLDALSVLFALLVTGIGALVTVYSGYYFAGDARAWRFQALMMGFGSAMLGLVMAGDVVTLFVFWEATSVLSFLLIGYRRDAASRQAARKSLLVTGGGGIALLAGLLLLADAAGTTQLTGILAAGAELRAHPAYLPILLLVAFGAFTKSAQVPAHIWLPGAMSAPTPASAYLHSATMVKAGIYLLMRLNPALGDTTEWFWLLTTAGATTMVVGAVVGLHQRDLKALLAYATVSQLGALVLLAGQETSLAYKALAIGVLAHALYKSALFLVVGIVDHEAGTRDMARLGGILRKMPATGLVAIVAALSMAGLPPMFGFLAKETLLATAVQPELPKLLNTVLPLCSVISGALMLAMAALLVWETFLGAPGESHGRAHDPKFGMLLMPAVPAVLSLAVGVLPEPERLGSLLAAAATEAYGSEVTVSLALWTGLGVPLFLSAVAISLGIAVFVGREPARHWARRAAPGLTADRAYDGGMAALFRLARAAASLQNGRLGSYLTVILVGTFGAGLGALALSPPAISAEPFARPTMDLPGALTVLRLFTLAAAVVGAGASVVLRRDLAAILALTVSGLAVALLMVLEPAPDVALVQIVVDLLATVILVLALARLPGRDRREAGTRSSKARGSSAGRDLVVAALAAVTVAGATVAALETRPRQSGLTPMYALSAKPATGARDIVGAIVVDFRALDTLVEITVFAMAGLGAFSLLGRVSPPHGPRSSAPGPTGAAVPDRAPAVRFGIGGAVTSSFVHVLAYAALPVSVVIAAVQVLYGHDRPGDGFTAGVIVSLALGFWYVVFGYEATRRRLGWLRPMGLAGTGLALALAGGLLGWWLDGSPLGPVDIGRLVGIPAPPGVHWSTSLLFEAAIALTVIGAASSMLDALRMTGPVGRGEALGTAAEPGNGQGLTGEAP